MTCTTQTDLTQQQKTAQQSALRRLQDAIRAGEVTVVVGRNGALAFRGWKDNAGISDLCAYRALMNTPEVRRAVARAEALAGVKVSRLAIATGVHSHDGGGSWHSGH